MSRSTIAPNDFILRARITQNAERAMVAMLCLKEIDIARLPVLTDRSEPQLVCDRPDSGAIGPVGPAVVQHRAFRRTAPGEFGSTPRNVIRGPGLTNVDLSLRKRVKLDAVTRGMNVDVRIDAFDAFNNVNRMPPNLNFASAAFGRIGSALDAREFQAGVKIGF